MFGGHLHERSLPDSDFKAEDEKRLSKSLRNGFWAQNKSLRNLSESIKQNLTIQSINIMKGLETVF